MKCKINKSVRIQRQSSIVAENRKREELKLSKMKEEHPQHPKRHAKPFKQPTAYNRTVPESTCIDSKAFQIDVKPATRLFDDNAQDPIPSYSTHSKNRGYVLITNNINYANGQKRKGAEIDGRRLQELFEQMGLIVQMHIDLSSTKMREAVINFRSNPQLKNTDMAFVILMGYGDHVNEVSSIMGTDHTYITAKWVEEQFNYANCNALHKKPKIFIYQASRGTLRDFGVPPLMAVNSIPRRVSDKHTEIDSISEIIIKAPESISVAQATLDDERTHMNSDRRTVLREQEDMLVVNSTLPGYASYRNIYEGTWYIQTFCNVMMNYAHEHHLENILKMVDFQLATRQSAEGNMQTSMFTSYGFNRHCYMHPKIYAKDGVIRNIRDDSVIL